MTLTNHKIKIGRYQNIVLISAYFILLYFFQSCTARKINILGINYNNNHSFTLTTNNAIIIKLSNFNDSCITYIDNSNYHIYQYNFFKNQITDSFDINHFKYQRVFNYLWYSPDTAIVSYNTTYLNDFHDSAYLLIDRANNNILTLNYSNIPVAIYSIDSQKMFKQNQYWYANNIGMPIGYDANNNSIDVIIKTFRKTIAKDISLLETPVLYRTFFDKKNPPIPYNVTMDSANNLYQPNEKIINDLPIGCYSNDGKPLIGYSYSNRVWYNNQYFEIQSNIYNNIDKNMYAMEHKEYIYDHYHNVYYRISEIYPRDSIIRNNKINRNYLLTQFNKNFKVTAENWIDNKYGSLIIPTKYGLLLYNKSLSKDNNIGTLNLCKMEISSINLSEISKLTEEQLTKGNNIDRKSFNNRLYEISKTKTNLIIPLDHMPTNYRKIIMEFIDKNDYDNLAIHIFSKDGREFFLNKKNIYYHKNSHLERYIQAIEWPEIIELTEEKETIWKSRIYPTSQIDSLVHLLDIKK